MIPPNFFAEMAAKIYDSLYLLNPATGGTYTIDQFQPPETSGQFTVTESTTVPLGLFEPGETVTSNLSSPTLTTYIGTIALILPGGTQTQSRPVFADASGNYYVAGSGLNSSISYSSTTINSVATSPACLCGDVQIATTAGSRFVGDLAIGDELLTPSGFRKVVFIGQSVRGLADLRVHGRMPIRIEAGALGDLGPDAAIHCSPSHAFAIQGCLVEAQALINGTTIRQLSDWNDFFLTYYSIELDRHELIYANGLLTESFFPVQRSEGSLRSAWTNYEEYLNLVGCDKELEELGLPRIPFARQLPASIREIVASPKPADSCCFGLN